MWSKGDSYNFTFVVYSSFEKRLEKPDGETKNISENFFKIHFWSGRLS